MFAILETQNWAQSSKVFPMEFCRNLALECQNKQTQGALRPASIGYRNAKMRASALRGDFTFWLAENSASAIEQDFMRALQEILQNLNEYFYLGLKRFETHFALYPPGGGYVKHVDNHHGMGARKITFVLYLNEEWQPDHGGELSLYDPTDIETKITEVLPHLGTLVLFRSDLFPHQVEKSFQNRQSLTGWFRNDAS